MKLYKSDLPAARRRLAPAPSALNLIDLRKRFLVADNNNKKAAVSKGANIIIYGG